MNQKSLLTHGLTLAVVVLMVGSSELSGQREIIFPEVTAIAVGLFLAPKQSWQVSKPRIFWLITLCAWAGLFISLWMPGPLWGKLWAAFFFCQLVLLVSGTSFAPLISAGVLPVMLGSESMVYPIAAMALTGLLVLLRLALEQGGQKEKAPFTPLPPPDKSQWLRLLARCGIGSACIGLAVWLNTPFAAAPPILVAFTEFSRPGNPARKTPFRTAGLIFFCALAGAACRYFLTMELGWWLTLSAAGAVAVMLGLMKAFRLYLPPAGALAILAMLIPENAVVWYPLEVLAGVCVFLGAACLMNWREYQTKSKQTS